MLQEHITAVLMRYATTQKDRTTANVNLDILEMGRYAKVTLVVSVVLVHVFLIKPARSY